MVNDNNKRTREEQDHKDLVISNVEFAMMQFYKSQWEAAQARIQQQEHHIKRQKRELQHVNSVLRGVQNQLLDARLEINHISDTNHLLHEQFIEANNHRVILSNAREASELTTLRFMELIDTIFNDHPDLESKYEDRKEWIAEQGLTTRLLAGIPLVSTLHDDSDTETEPEE